MNERRLMRLAVTPEFFATLTSGTCRVTAHSLPEDARLVSSYYDGERDIFGMVFQSEAYQPIPWSAVIPLMDSPTIERTEA